MELALQKIPASVGPDRWDRIALEVPGKTKGECVKRYKEIVAALKAKKAAARAKRFAFRPKSVRLSFSMIKPLEKPW